MAERAVVRARPHGTSWMSVIGGWIAAVGMTALLAPIVAALVANRGGGPDDLSLAVPAIVGVMVAYLVGGYVAGRMAGYNTSWHGMMAAFWGLFVVLAIIGLAVLADRGYLGGLRIGGFEGAYAWGFGATTIGDALTFGAILGFLATIFAGWLGGLLAPDHVVAEVTRPAVAAAPTATAPTLDQTMAREAPVSRESHESREERVTERRPGFRLLPALGRKGGETVERREHVDADGDREVHETRVDRR